MSPHSITSGTVPCVIFAVISIINLVILLTEGVLLFIRKPKLVRHNYTILAGQLAKLIGAAVMFLLPQNTALFPAIICPCAAVCLISGILIGRDIPSQKQLFQQLWRMVYLLCCIYVAGFLVIFVSGGNNAFS